MFEVIDINSQKRCQLIDVTADVKRLVEAAEIEDGLCLLYVPHTTAAVTVNENADPAVPADIISELGRLVPCRAEFRHLEGNSDAHIKSTLVGNTRQFIINQHKLILGTWQAIFFCEFDGPRRRKLLVKITAGQKTV